MDSEKAKKKQKRDIIITAVLLVIFAFTFTKNVLMRKGAPVPAAVIAEDSQSMADQLVYVTRLRVYDKLRDEQKGVWEKDWGRDPFVPQALATITKAVNLTLNGILWDDSNPKAIVNQKALLKGDTLYGYTVIEIKPRSVILRTGEKNIELTVFRSAAAES